MSTSPSRWSASPGWATALPGTLSGGQQQRVALARALAPSPRVLLLDEPFSNLDTALRVRVRAEVRRLLTELGVTSLFVTHDQEEAFVLGDRVGVMRDGVLEQLGTPSELYGRPVSPWVAEFVGDANLVAGHGARRRWSTPRSGRFPSSRRRLRPGGRALARPEHLDLEAGGDGQRRARRVLRPRHALRGPARRRRGRPGSPRPARCRIARATRSASPAAAQPTVAWTAA